MYVHLGTDYELNSVALPVVQIICITESHEEKTRIDADIITVTEDCTGWNLISVLDACENTYKMWKADREGKE